MQNFICVQQLNRTLQRRRFLGSAKSFLIACAGLAMVAAAWIAACLIVGIGAGIVRAAYRITLSSLGWL